jgi:LuxR family transcriptional regulator, maltose regulon positive regulatory protein
LVLDDYHLINAPEIQRAVTLLLERLSPNAHLVVATRADPSLPLARLRARGELVELRADALRFTVDEARTFFSDRMGLTLSEDDLATLVARTEGWPAVLQLAGVSLAGRTDISRHVQDFAASHRYVLDYITDEVLARLDAADRDFLMQTSVLDRLTGSLCDALTDRTDGQRTLGRLEQANVLLVQLDDERRWYRYHHLFADLLRARLAYADPARPATLHLRAAEWYERNGRVPEAIEQALRSGEAERACGLIASASGELVYTGQFATLLGWLDRLPEAAVRSSLLFSTFYALALVLSGRSEGVERRVVDAEAALPAAAANGEPGAAIMPAYFALIRSIAARLEHDLPAAVGHAERALTLALPGVDVLVADARTTLGHALLEAGQLDRALEAYRAALPAEQAVGNLMAVADIIRNLARLEARRGHVRAALEACDATLANFGGADGTEIPAAAGIHLARAEILERSGDLGAVATAERAIELARRGGDVVTLREARALRDRAAAQPARPRTATDLVEPLTERELVVLRLVAAGRSNRQIAAELYVTVGTVKTHVHAVSGKLGAANRVEAVARARERGLL